MREIYGLYGELEPSRQEINFDSSIFEGITEKIMILEESKENICQKDRVEDQKEQQIVTKSNIIKLEDGGHWEERQIWRESDERWTATLRSWFLLGAWGWAETRMERTLVKDFKEVIEDSEEVKECVVPYLRKSMIRIHYRRQKFEEWKVCAGGLRIFKGYSESDWKNVQEEEIVTEYKKVPFLLCS